MFAGVGAGDARRAAADFSGALSALGILRADVVTEFSRTVLLTVTSAARAKSEIESGISTAGKAKGDGRWRLRDFRRSKIRIERRLDLRYAGQAYELSVPAAGDFVAAFHRAHEARYGYHDAKRTVEIVNLRVRATGVTDKPGLRKIAAATAAVSGRTRRGGTMDCVLDGRRCRAALIARDELRGGDSLSGPAVISEYSATTLVPHGWSGRVDAYGQILLTPLKRGGRGLSAGLSSGVAEWSRDARRDRFASIRRGTRNLQKHFPLHRGGDGRGAAPFGVFAEHQRAP